MSTTVGRSRLSTTLALLAALALAPGAASAQDAAIDGTIIDATGLVLPGVTVEARDHRMGRELAASVIERHRRRLNGRARRITIDLDPTDDRTHGAQQLTFFNSHYDSWCYLPLLAFVRFDHEVEQYLCAAVLRPGKAVAADGTLGVLSRLLPLLRCAFPRARFLVRLDGGFATPEIFDYLDAEPRLDYVVAMAKNAVLLRHAASAMVEARAKSAQDDETAHVYTDTRCYRAGTWDHERRVVIKAEVVRLAGREPRDNPRFVVTNLRQTPRFINAGSGVSI